MSFDYIRQVVSGNKARYVDRGSGVDLDLVYVTDRIIIMGYPAIGMAGLYRNRRRDVLKFINQRHGEKWWIWNLCPLYENAYSPESMHNRVSRYPFPDHHPPPLPLLPLAVKEMTAWLQGDEERIAIIHCKAGKGRSGTLLCSYLLSPDTLPPAPQLPTSYSTHDPSQLRHDNDDREANTEDPHTPARSEGLRVASRAGSTASSLTTISRPSPPPSVQISYLSEEAYAPMDIDDEGDLRRPGQRDRRDGKVDDVFRLHSSRRMKPTSSGRGVSIPSQRRWCRYVNLLFTNKAPPSYLSPVRTRVRLISITMLLNPPTTWQKPLASLVVGRSGGQGNAWASVARYDDDYVAELKCRGGGGEGVGGEITWGGVGGTGEWDTKKMFRSCGKMVSAPTSQDSDDDECIKHELVPKSGPLVLERGREVRLKFHLASLPLGWTWFIPAFHLPEPVPSTKTPIKQKVHTLHFDRSQIDFAIGPGASLRSVEVKLEEVPVDDMSEPARLLNDEEERAEGVDERVEHVREDGE
ncbi:hypothetical protein M231_03556 [Tremella mesenterica]|uniref:phosphatidylinositol-3,4,5-trisphosphate 3-phosphatase n=1 Tax=Tremella mesenterica TaxID=5217 RepID=A0A4Q1BMX2_TREME|nr:hypothetical protein M231_03556 [Tremella mesenterica]